MPAGRDSVLVKVTDTLPLVQPWFNKGLVLAIVLG